MKENSGSKTGSNAAKAILFAGLLTGVLDLTAACVTNYWINPVRIFQSIAAGLFGAESYKGGAPTAILGIFLHFVIAFGATVVFYLAGRKIKFLLDQPIISGVIYGILVYWFMQLVVLPLSAFPGKFNFTPGQIIKGLIVHIICVGLPIALTIRYFTRAE